MYKFDRSTLPTAPKAALGPKVDLSQIPRDGPFSAYVGNIPYDAKESDLAAFFQKLDVSWFFFFFLHLYYLILQGADNC